MCDPLDIELKPVERGTEGANAQGPGDL